MMMSVACAAKRVNIWVHGPTAVSVAHVACVTTKSHERLGNVWVCDPVTAGDHVENHVTTKGHADVCCLCFWLKLY